MQLYLKHWEPDMVNDMQYRELLALRLEVNTAIEKIEKQAFQSLEAGDAVPGFELKKGRKSRIIVDESALVKGVRSWIPATDLYQAKMIGIPAIETKLKDLNVPVDVLEPFLKITEGKSSLVYKG